MSETYNGCDTNEYIAVPGPQGPQGQRGAQGLRGPMGPEGPQGLTGAVGPQGPCGPKGDRGPRGEKGDKGEPGTPGARGPEGPEGPRGCTGAAGRDGTVMFEELTKDQIEQLRGPAGPIGPRGPQGPRGAEGRQGATGLQGPMGPNGQQGPKGNDGAQGPRGLVGPAGPQGPKGDKGEGIGHSDHIGESTTWNSKTIVDYALHGKVRWTEHTLNHSGVEGTANGFAKDLKVLGRTVHNYVNEEIFRNPLKTNGTTEMKWTDGRVVYTPKQGKAIMEGPGDNGNAIYSLIFDLKILSDGRGLHEGDKAIITVRSGGQVTTYGDKKLQEGRNKFDFEVPHGAATEVRVNFYYTEFPSGEHEEDIVFDIENVMILIGDYTQKIAPRYFWGTRGVGDKIKNSTPDDKRRVLVLESRNKNLINVDELITDKYLSKADAGDGQLKMRWTQGLKGEFASFLVYCEQGEYTISLKAKNGMNDKLRLFIGGYHDTPTNGEIAKEEYLAEDTIIGEYKAHKFQVGPDVNVIAIYIANLGKVPMQTPFKDVIEYVQLEKGNKATEYVPYKSIEKRLIIPRQLMNDDVLEWSDSARQYLITSRLSPTQHEDTGITEESFLSTFEDKTYMYIKNKIYSVIEAKFPIKIDGEKIYTKDEWQFKGDDPLQPNENLHNLLKLPNGFAMQWKNILYRFEQGQRSRNEDFLMLNNIIYADVSMAEDVGDSENEGLYNFTTFKTRIFGENSNKVEVIRQYQGNAHDGASQKYPAQNFRLRVLVFADMRPPEER